MSIAVCCGLSTQYIPGTICKPKTSEYIMINVFLHYAHCANFSWKGLVRRIRNSKEWKNETIEQFSLKEMIPKSVRVSQTLYLPASVQNPLFNVFARTVINITLLKWHTQQDIKQGVSKDVLKLTLNPSI